MKTRYFSFGQTHTHSFNGHTLDKDCIVKITAENPREIMVEFKINGGLNIQISQRKV